MGKAGARDDGDELAIIITMTSLLSARHHHWTTSLVAPRRAARSSRTGVQGSGRPSRGS